MYVTGPTAKVLECMFGKPDHNSHVVLYRWYQQFPFLRK